MRERANTIEPCGGEKAKMIYSKQHLRFLHFLARPQRSAAWELKSYFITTCSAATALSKSFLRGHSQISFSYKSRVVAGVQIFCGSRGLSPANLAALSGARMWRKEAKDACPAQPHWR